MPIAMPVARYPAAARCYAVPQKYTFCSPHTPLDTPSQRPQARTAAQFPLSGIRASLYSCFDTASSASRRLAVALEGLAPTWNNSPNNGFNPGSVGLN